MTTAGRKNRRGRAARALALLGALLPLATALGQGSIQLRPAVVSDGQGPVRLSDVATLSGPDAESLGDTVLIESLAAKLSGERSSCAIGIEDVRAALKARPGVRWSALTLRGGTCTIRRPKAAAPAAAPVEPTPEVPAAPAADGTIRGLVADKIADLLGVGGEDLKLTFDPSDGALLDAAAAGTVEIVATGMSDRMPLAVTVYDGPRVRATKSIRVGVLVRRPVVIAVNAKRRAEEIGAEDIRTEERWVGPTVRAADQVVGAVARSRIAPGELITIGDIEQPVAVKKGERVEVHCVSGRVIVKTKARAMMSGREGDVLQFESLDGSKRTFAARVDGRGRAVTTAEAADEPVSTEGNQR